MMNLTGALLLTLCASLGFASSSQLTMLLPGGNREVAQRFADFEQTQGGCQAKGEGPRVMLTGFGLFEGVPYNISGAVIENLASTQFWPDTLDAASGVLPVVAQPFQTGTLSQDDHGARIYNRQFLIGGRKVEACLIVADVLWDFAGAVFVREMERFQPQVVIMTGLGQGSLEAGAINHALDAPGFAPDGHMDQLNVPQDLRILPDMPLDRTVAMTWNSRSLGKRVERKVEALGFRLFIPAAAQPSNDYICNNVSYLVIEAAQNRKLALAGGELVLQPQIYSQPKIGFFHYPAQAAIEQSPAWAQVVLALVEGSLPRHRAKKSLRSFRT